MNEVPPNPYRDLTLGDLHQVMNERAGELLQRSRVGRQDLAYLLMAASHVIDPGGNIVGRPAHQVRKGADIEQAFWPEFESDVRAVMNRLFNQARDAAELGWPDLHRYSALMREQKTPIGWDTRTEEDFRRSLQQLQALKDLKARDWSL